MQKIVNELLVLKLFQRSDDDLFFRSMPTAATNPVSFRNTTIPGCPNLGNATLSYRLGKHIQGHAMIIKQLWSKCRLHVISLG